MAVEIEEVKAVVPLKLALVPITTRVLEELLSLPRGVQIVSVSYDETYRVVKLLLAGDDLPEVREGEPIRQGSLYCSVEYSPDMPIMFRHITTEVKVDPWWDK